MYDYYNQVKGNTVPNSVVQKEQARKEQVQKEQQIQKEQQMQKEQQRQKEQQAWPANSAASFFGASQGIAGPPITTPALSPETIATVVQYLLGQAAARGSGQ